MLKNQELERFGETGTALGDLVANLVVLDRGETDRFPALGLVVQREFVLRQEYRIIVEIAGNVAAMRFDKALQVELVFG